MKGKLLKTGTVCMALTLLLSGCGGGSDTSETTDTVTIAKAVDVMSMDSTIATDGMSFEIIAATTDGLFTLDKEGNAIPALSDGEPSVSADGKVITFKLKDAKWSNGETVTADDFVFAFEKLANPATASEYNYMLGAGVAEIVNADAVIAGEMKPEELGVKALDKKTFEVSLTKPVVFFNSLMTFPIFYPQNQKFVEKQGDQYALTPDNLLACGPYKMTSWESKSKIKLVKNKEYYDKKNVKTNNLTFKIISDPNTSALDFGQGANDFTKLSGELVDKYKDDKNFKNVLDGYLWYVQLNFKTPGLENVNLRKALALTMEKDKIVKDILKDGSVAADFFVPVKLATGPDGKDFRDGNGKYLQTDLTKAKEYYESAKAETGKSTFEFELLYEEEGNIKQIAEFIQNKVQKNLPGVTITLKSQPKKNRIELMKQHDFQLAITRWGPDYADPTTYLNLMLEDNGYNYGLYTSKPYNDLMAKSGNEASVENRWQDLKDAEKVMLEDDAAVIPLYQVGGASLVRKSVSGIENHSVGVPYIYKNVVKAAK
ncbi:MAG: peptide ABC transporter substrate-binding protein [Erysipelotrichaceae bacterium]